LQRAVKLAKKRRVGKTEAILRQKTNQTIQEGVLK